jgi:hypothetical protein
MVRSAAAVVTALSFLVVLGGSQRASAQPMPAGGAFMRACSAADLPQDVQNEQKVCVVGVVRDATKIDVFMSNRSEVIFKTVEVFRTKITQNAMEPIEGLERLKGQVVAVGGFGNASSIFSARILVPRQ